jgi:hypothetical protein
VTGARGGIPLVAEHVWRQRLLRSGYLVIEDPWSRAPDAAPHKTPAWPPPHPLAAAVRRGL